MGRSKKTGQDVQVRHDNTEAIQMEKEIKQTIIGLALLILGCLSIIAVLLSIEDYPYYESKMFPYVFCGIIGFFMFLILMAMPRRKIIAGKGRQTTSNRGTGR